MIDLLFKYFRGETTPEEEQRIGQWLEDDPVENAKQYKTARFIFEGSVLYGRPHLLSGMLAWRRIGRYAAAVAAAVVLMLGTGYFIRQQTFESLSGQLAVLETPAGQRARMVLPDGTQVWLNADTRMEYPAVFAKGERRVKLAGEALFEVVHDSRSPFIVETFASEVEVLGTRFNVLADAGSNLFSTMLLQGRVKVTNRSDERDVIIMNPDEVVNLVDGRLTLDNRQDPAALCWLDGQVSFGGLAFDALMSRFEKAFGVKIIIERADLPKTGYSRGKVRVADGIDHALRVLQHSIDFTYEKDEMNNTITIR
ncbi:FecR family protein [Alistipes sp.]|uniref:FecR family protein n=1 Tax=Alistipes sp. TaxID=1872444 RepID=UPI003AEFEBB5